MTDDDTAKPLEHAWQKKIDNELADLKEIVAALCAEVFGDDEEFKATANSEDVVAEIDGEAEDEDVPGVSPEDVDVIFYDVGDGLGCKLRVSGDGKPFIAVEDDESCESFDLVDFLANFDVTEAREELLRVLGRAIISAHGASDEDPFETEGRAGGD
jgi:hypothetical protein